MGSKAIVFLGLVLALVLFISSEVAARDLAAETSNTIDTSEVTNGHGVDSTIDAKYEGGGNGGGYGGGRGGNGGGYGGGRGNYGGGRGKYGGGRGNYGGGRGNYCRYGCCGRSYNRGGCQCCTYAGQKVDGAKP